MPSGIYISNACSANPIIPFSASGTMRTKYNASAVMQRRRRSQIPIQLSTVRPLIVTKDISFVSVIQGQQIQAGDFLYVSEDGLVEIYNLSGIINSVTAYSPSSFAIPILESQIDRLVFSDFHVEELL